MNRNSIYRAATAVVVIASTLVACSNTSSTPTQEQRANPIATPMAEEPMGDASKAARIVVSKQSMTLSLYDSDDLLICRFGIAAGKHYGNKQRSGDMKTPEGDFYIEQIQDAHTWGHDFGDGKGYIANCYGNWFLRLKTPPHRGIGIHGTHDPASIGTRATEGCIRLENNDLDSLKQLVRVGMRVTIEPSSLDRKADGVAEPAPAPKAEIVTTVDNEPKSAPTPTATTSSERATTTNAKASAETESSEEWYTVKDGDLVGQIAIDNHTTTAEIRRLNPNINIDRISIGQRIRIRGKATTTTTDVEAKASAEPTPKPAAESTASAPAEGEVWHTVVDGDLVSRIAARYGTSSRKIAELNPDVNIDRIAIGQRIRVK